MKFAVIVSAAALAAVTNAEVCDVTSLSKLMSSPDTTKCATESKYAVTSLKTPTNEQLRVMCSNTACQSVMSKIKTLAPTECTLGTFTLYADLVNPLTAYCNSLGSVAGSPATPNVTVGSSNTTSNNTTSNVTEPGSKTPKTPKDNTYTFTSGTTDTNADQTKKPTPDSTDDTKTNQNIPTPNAMEDTNADQNALNPDETVYTSLVQRTTSSNALGEANADQTTLPDSNTLDENKTGSISGAISVSMSCVSAAASVVAAAATIF